MQENLGDEEEDVLRIWVSGSTHTDNKHHGIARTLLLQRLKYHRKTIEACLTWAEAIELEPIAWDLHLAIKQAKGADVITLCKKDFVKVWNQHDRKVDEAFAYVHVRDELRLVDSSGEPWKWLVREIPLLWFTKMCSSALHQHIPYPVEYEYKPDMPMEFNFKSEPSESFEESIRRLKSETKAFIKEQTKRQMPTGYSLDKAIVEKYTKWFFMHKIERIPSAKIAMDAGYDDDKSVRRNIAKVEEWLRLGL